jgi:hypothetical protein
VRRVDNGAERRREMDDEIESVIDELEADSMDDDLEVAAGPTTRSECPSFIRAC